MMRVLITGANSYIGDSFMSYVSNKNYQVDTIDMMTKEWIETDFSKYDVVLHVAAIVHKKERDYTNEEYYKINTELAFDVAEKAKCSGVKQFILMSTMNVYGKDVGIISNETSLSPVTAYGKTKLKAEQMIQELCDDSFSVVILRPPIVYGKNCKGNYVTLSKFAKKLPFFPDYESYRSMIYIDNLCEFIKKSIDEGLCGVFCPQDEHYVMTSKMVRLVAKANGKDIKMTKLFNPLITLGMKLKIRILCKVFGTLVYDDSLKLEYDRVDLETAIRKTEE
ncbi:MAG: NAD-dependent epimerase/dehydratase family protein [Ruminococcus sp.]|nr:NAD-dependent epimerase/dehydratase family protein [Ruminococcus sp.]